jgi:cytochrome c oxidase assembly protein subunit 15
MRPIAIWLLVCCAMIFVMVVLGGVTRLTHSGLSMVEWRPLLGWLPPLTEAAWEEAFAKYKSFPEYQKLNYGMALGEFKAIFWMEYVHRLWGRSIAIVFIFPFLYFLATGRVPKHLRPHLALMFVLGALQGLLGWYMVKSGLIDRPDVSQYRLTAHLGAAFLIYAYILWVALGLLAPAPKGLHGPTALRPASMVLVGLVFLTALSGGLVAGLDAGFAYNTFPLMAGRLVPEGLFDQAPVYMNFFDNVTTVQFVHRVVAILTFASVLLFWLRARGIALPPSVRLPIEAFMGLAAVQVALGISTLLLVVPVPLAAAHQAGALLMFSAALWTARALRRATPAPAGPEAALASPASAP